MSANRQRILDRFNVKYQVTPGCWPWTAGKDQKNYGMFWMNGKTLHAQRVAYELFIGPIPDGLVILHSCDNPSCVNPSHLSAGTHKENSEDMVSKGRQARGRSIGKNKLHEHQIKEIRADQRIHRLIALDYGVSRTMVSYIKKNKFWGHV